MPKEKITKEEILDAVYKCFSDFEKKMVTKKYFDEKLEEKLNDKLDPIKQRLHSIEQKLEYIENKLDNVIKSTNEDILVLNDDITKIKENQKTLNSRVFSLENK